MSADGSFKRENTPFTFKGDRGGSAEDAELLAELRKISSGNTDRFEANEDEMTAENETSSAQPFQPAEEKSLPPWKRGKARKKAIGGAKSSVRDRSKQRESEEAGKRSAMKSSLPDAGELSDVGGFENRETPFTFKGDHGGKADDAELLAELKKISGGGADRFRDDNEDESCPLDMNKAGNRQVPKNPPDSFVASRKGDKEARKSEQLMSQNPTQPAEDMAQARGNDSSAGGFQKSEMPFTFKGDRGGAAEDADLLAELKRISSGGADRFRDDNEDDKGTSFETTGPDTQESQSRPDDSSSPPRRKGKPNTTTGSAMSPKRGVGPKPSESAETREHTTGQERVGDGASKSKSGGFAKSTMPFTFKGDRGGTAEDADLLAELKAISNGSADRFQDETENENLDGSGLGNSQQAEPKSEPALPPWKKGKPKKVAGSTKSTSSATRASNVKESEAKSRGNFEADSADHEASLAESGGFQKTSMPFTFKGDRGGAAEDEELLAELKKIGGGGTDRFRDDHEDNPNGRFEESKPSAPRPAAPKPPTATPVATDATGDGGVSSSLSSEATFQKSDMPFTFKGDRGGAAEDAELLAELRKISGGGADRFRDDDLDETLTSETKAAEPSRVQQQETLDSSLPPWKRAKPKKAPTMRTKKSSSPGGSKEEAESATPEERRGAESGAIATDETADSLSATGGFQKSNMPFTFKGDRGGSAEDADLLAELKKISGGGGDRFRDDNEDENYTSDPTQIQEQETVDLPPWKRAKPKKAHTVRGKRGPASLGSNVSDGKSATPKEPGGQGENAGETADSLTASGGFQKSNMPFTFKGDRGGSAEDAELLAELKKVSGGGGDRFRDNEDEDGTSDMHSTQIQEQETVYSSLPPWKRAKPKKAPTVRAKKVSPSLRDVKEGQSVVAEEQRMGHSENAVSDAAADSLPASGGFQKSDMPFTFKGDRGGSAEDAELLAELRKISGGGGDRFQDDEDENKNPGELETVPRSKPPKGTAGEKAKEQSMEDAPKFQKSAMPFTFKGDRGGSAEDAELLAELKKISGAGGRFRDDDTEDPPPLSKEAPSQKQPRQGGSTTSSSVAADSRRPHRTVVEPAPPATSAAASDVETSEEDEVTFENLSESVASKNWKLRKASYEFLTRELSKKVNDLPDEGVVDANEMLESLDDMIPEFVKDSNAGALDAALQFCVMYCDRCVGAGSSDRAKDIALACLKGSGLSSTRPTTGKLSKALLLKLMEVGDDGPQSVQGVVEALVEGGLVSPKPKLVLNAAQLILEAALSFGAVHLPLGSVAAATQKMLSHSNAKVREAGMKTIAEVCRATASTKPMEKAINQLKPAQKSQLDKLLEEQPEASPPTVGLRSMKGMNANMSSAEALAMVEAKAKEEEAKRFANRPAINLFEALNKSEYSTKLKLAKWSEKVGALDILIACGGEQPFKLQQPSQSVNYAPLISDLKKLLSHTHFAVNSKAMAALMMLSEGVGEKLYPLLRPLLTTLCGMSKDKKLTAAVGKCLDSFFGNILSFDHLLETEDALPAALDERKQKNALARASTLEFLRRCVERGETAGKRGSFSVDACDKVVSLACLKLRDSDPHPRKAAQDILQLLLASERAEVVELVQSAVDAMEKSNPRAYSALTSKKEPPKGSSKSPAGSPPAQSTKAEGGKPRATHEKQKASPKNKASGGNKSDSGGASSQEQRTPENEADGGSPPSLSSALAVVESLGVPGWNDSEDDGGVLAGLKSATWKSRMGAIDALASYVRSDELQGRPGKIPSSPILAVVREHTKNFKESNFNVLKSIMELFSNLMAVHEHRQEVPPVWICNAGTISCVDKISDKKLASLASSLLTTFCIVQKPALVVSFAVQAVESIKAPLQHEALLLWCLAVCRGFGGSSFGGDVKGLVSWIVTESKSANAKVRKAALTLAGELHSQLGPVFRAVALSFEMPDAVRSQLEATFESAPFDPAASTIDRPKKCMTQRSAESGDPDSDCFTPEIEIPRTDLVGSLPSDCLARLAMKEGKNAWKSRKAAMDELSQALTKCSGLVATTQKPFTSLVELLRKLRERLSDSQSNLKPVAAKLIGKILGAVDRGAQPRLGKLVYAPLISAGMNDNKKMMREAALSALESGTQLSELEGGAPNIKSLECMMGALVSELNDSEYKGGGLPEILIFVTSRVPYLIKVEDLVDAKAQALEASFSSSIVACLTSSKNETRAAAESLLRKGVQERTMNVSNIRNGTKNLLPAQQRTITPILVSICGEEDVSAETRNVVGKKEGDKPPQLAKPSPRNGTSPPRRRPTPRQNRESLMPRREAKAEEKGPEVDDALVENPLRGLGATNSTKESRTSMVTRKKDPWPEFPELPARGQYLSLKKAWSQVVSSPTIEILFPADGINKQEDAVEGCHLLSKAVAVARETGDDTVIEQLDLIHKWIVCGLCSREHTSGMQALLSCVEELVSFLASKQYQLSDFEATIILPHMVEKAGVGKGRFRDMLHKILTSTRNDGVFPAQKYGPIVCVPVMERSGHGKARVLALRECKLCVDEAGLNGIGKRGIQVTAKTLSEESLAEVKTAGLDLMEALLHKMGGDLQRLSKICGTHLSAKGKSAVEERWSKRSRPVSDEASHGSHDDLPGAGRKATLRSGQAARLQRESLDFRGRPPHAESKLSRAPATQSADLSVHDEVPALNLRLDGDLKQISHHLSLDERNTEGGQSEGPFTFRYDPSKHLEIQQRKNADSGVRVGRLNMYEEWERQRQTAAMPNEQLEEAEAVKYESRTDVGSPVNNEAVDNHLSLKGEVSPEEAGAAASLRARLQNIKQKHRMSRVPNPDKGTESSGDVPSSRTRVSVGRVGSTLPQQVQESTKETPRVASSYPLYDNVIADLKALRIRDIAKYGEDPQYLRGLEAIKSLHAALTLDSTDHTRTDLTEIRQGIANRVSECVECLTGVLEFGFNSERSSQSGGMSIPILSVTLATLMGLFRDNQLSSLVSTDALSLVIRHAATGLLDPRLAATKPDVGTNLDEATSSQLVRAINKLAIQAAVSTPRHRALQALLSLQLDFWINRIHQGVPLTDTSNINYRLSRIVSKLFTRIVKAEESASEPYSFKRAELESVYHSLERGLSRSSQQFDRQSESSNPFFEQARALITSMLQSRSPYKDANGLLVALDSAGFDRNSSALVRLVLSCDSEVLASETSISPLSSQLHGVENVRVDGNSKGYRDGQVANLLSEVGTAPDDSERAVAIEKLRQFAKANPDVDIQLHLAKVSAPFRSYIMDQLQLRGGTTDYRRDERGGSKAGNRGADSQVARGASRNMAMSERLRNLKSKLNATEAVVMSTISQDDGDGVAIAPSSSFALSSRVDERTMSFDDQQDRKSSLSALRQRLAAAQDTKSKSKNEEAPAGSSVSEVKRDARPNSSYGHAAALRARLEAVKHGRK